MAEFKAAGVQPVAISVDAPEVSRRLVHGRRDLGAPGDVHLQRQRPPAESPDRKSVV